MLRRLTLAVVAALFLSTAVGRADEEFPIPKQTILGADKPIPLGEMVDMSLSPLESKPVTLISTSEVWRVYDVNPDVSLTEKRVREYTDSSGKRGVFFGAGIADKKMLVLVAVTYLYVVKDEKDPSKVNKVATRTSLLTAELTIGNGKPKPPEPPSPKPVPPAPGPNLPDGKYGLAKFIYNQVTLYTPAESRKAWAQVHIKAYREVVALANKGEFKDSRELLVKTQQLVKTHKTAASLPATDAGWAKVADAIEQKLFDLYSNKQLNSVEDFKLAFEEISVGLEAVN